ncbi:MAG TPA: hypothetical protein VGN27_11525 [Gaiellaceae bacterium]|jgi:uncharacterized protein YndB with AHSA1/START domain|nr:hypothetical protein [Gaiellaceae bacterium]
MPRYAATRTLLAPLPAVWAFLIEPHNLPDWWPGLGGVVPDRRGVAPGARWAIQGTEAGAPLRPLFGPGMLRRPGAAGTLLVLDVVQGRRLEFQLVNERITAELELTPVDASRTEVALAVDAPWATVRRTYAKDALRRLFDLMQTSVEP